MYRNSAGRGAIMNTKVMEGLAGASTSMNLLKTPMRVYKEARLRGDTAVMERAAGYVGDFAGRAEEYKTEAYKGMKEEAKDAKKRAEEERMEAAKRRKEERAELEKRIEENRIKDAAMTRADGKSLPEDNIQNGGEGPDGKVTGSTENAAASKPVIYTKTGDTQAEAGTNISISLSV